jgi:membrane protein DedA with SNARE-associated domain
MADDGTSVKRGAINRILAGLLGVAAASIIGGIGVVAVYYPLRHANFAVQWLLVFLMMIGESAAIHLPSEVILPVGGWLVVREHHLGVTGTVALSAIAAIANTIGSGMLYAAGWWGGRPLVRRYGHWFLLHERDVDAAERRMSKHRVWALFAARLLPVIRTYVGFVGGILRIPPTTFTLVTFAGSFVWCSLFVGAGALLGAHWSTIRQPAEGAGVAIVILLIMGLGAITITQLRQTSA